MNRALLVVIMLVGCGSQSKEPPPKKFLCAQGYLQRCFNSVPACVMTTLFSGGEECYDQDRAWCAWDDDEGTVCWATPAACAKYAPALEAGHAGGTPTCHRVDDAREIVRPVVQPGAARGR